MFDIAGNIFWECKYTTQLSVIDFVFLDILM